MDFAKQLQAMTVMQIINSALPTVMATVVDRDTEELWDAYWQAEKANRRLWELTGKGQ